VQGDNVTKQLLPHQIEDAQFLAARSFAGNFSGMGSGKTLTALEAFRLARELVTDQVIIVGPPISLRMWASEFEAFFPGDKAQLVKTGKTKIDGGATALVMSYEIATKRAAELSQLGARALILDEAHACKSIKAKRTKALLGCGGLASSVQHCWFLTGTPSTRWNDDLYPFLCRADLQGMSRRCGGKTLDKFRLRYCVTQAKYYSSKQTKPIMVTVGNRHTDELNDWLFSDGLAVRRELAEVWAAMPPLTINRLEITLSGDADFKAMLKQLSSMSASQIDMAISQNDEHIATARRKVGEAKVSSAAAAILDRAESGAGALLVGAWHTSVIDGLVEELRASGLRVDALDGRTSSSRKSELQDAFNNGDLDVLVGQIAAMGVSLNLQHGGNRIVVVEEDWSPSVMDQFYARLHRMGQTEHVHVDILTSDDPLSQAVGRIAGNKRAEHRRLMETA
jgi:SWI/SNF-related matrix-associated actin-dependent regulator 1 of chromatin subfamily A